MYFVVFKNITEGVYRGAITWSSFADQTAFEDWFVRKPQKDLCGVLEKGVSKERALEPCSSPEADRVNALILMREMVRIGYQP